MTQQIAETNLCIHEGGTVSRTLYYQKNFFFKQQKLRQIGSLPQISK